MADEPYAVFIKNKPKKRLESIVESERTAIEDLIDDLANNPRPDGCKCLNNRKKNPWRFRKGDRRVIYTIDTDERVVEVTKVGPRGDIYKGLK